MNCYFIPYPKSVAVNDLAEVFKIDLKIRGDVKLRGNLLID